MDNIAGKPVTPVVPSPAKTLKEKLSQQIKTTGRVNVSSADLADFSKPETKHEPVVGTVSTTVPPEAMKDPMMNKASAGEPGKAVAEKMEATSKDAKSTSDMALKDAEMLPIIEITESEREAFLDSVVKGTRFKLPFSIFNGKVSGSFRSRSQKESQAILARLNWEINDKRIATTLEYSTRLRNMLLTAQVEEIRDTKYLTLNEPLYRTLNGDKATDPGWLPQVEVWENEHEGLASALYTELQLFEHKYWTMVRNASDQNFWNPAESISK